MSQKPQAASTKNLNHEENKAQNSKKISQQQIEDMQEFLIRSRNDIANAPLSELQIIKDEMESRFNTIKLPYPEMLLNSQEIMIDPLIEKEYNKLLEQYYMDLRTIVRSMDRLAKEPIKIPIFYGDITEWSSFYFQFRKHVHENQDLTPVEKMNRLKAMVKGSEASELIRKLGVNIVGYENALKILNTRYENQRLLYNAWVDKFLDLPEIRIKSSSSVQKFLSTTYECLSVFKKLNVHKSDYEPLIARIIVRKLDRNGRNLYEYKYRATTEIQGLRDVLSFLETNSNGSEEDGTWPIVLSIFVICVVIVKKLRS